MTDIEWYYPERGKGIDASISDIVTHFPGVEAAIKLKANSMASEAWLQLMWHRRTGSAKIEVARHPKAGGRTPDWYVYMRDADPGGEGKAGKNKYDRSAMSIEFGWTQTHAFGRKLAKPLHHDGLDILGSVMRRSAAKYRGPR